MKIWNYIEKEIIQNYNVVLMLVLSSDGSSPGRQGFKMCVSSSGFMFGSIGGGVMEHKLVEESKKLALKPFLPFTKNLVHRKQENREESGLNCSGEQIVAFYFLNKENFVFNLSDNYSFEANKNGVFFNNKPCNSQFHLALFENEWCFIENLNFKNKLFIIGGGHVSFAFSQVMKNLDFEITIIENREKLNTLVDNSNADYKIISDYDQIDRIIPEGDNIYIAIMSFGYKTDEIAVRKLIGKKVKYIGSMGSKAKIRRLINALKNEGFEKIDIDKLKSPIGLDIKSKTPEEIAISIAAEIIKIKNS